jgi:hypothetical protein
MPSEITISRPKLLVLVFGILIMWGLSLHQYLLFIKAYMSPQKAVILYINVFGEANFEIVLLTISMIIGTFAIFSILWFLRKLNKGECTVKNGG